MDFSWSGPVGRSLCGNRGCGHYYGMHVLANGTDIIRAEVDQRSGNPEKAITGNVSNVISSNAGRTGQSAVSTVRNSAEQVPGGIGGAATGSTVRSSLHNMNTGFGMRGTIDQPNMMQQYGLPGSQVSMGLAGIPRFPVRGQSTYGFPSSCGFGTSSLANSTPSGRYRGRGHGQVKRFRGEGWRSSAPATPTAPRAEEEDPEVAWIHMWTVYLFRFNDDHPIPHARQSEGANEIELMHLAGLVKDINFAKLHLTGDFINSKIMAAFNHFLEGRPWILLTRIPATNQTKNKPKYKPEGNNVHSWDLPLSSATWSQYQRYTEQLPQETRRRMYIAIREGMITIPFEIVQQLADSKGISVDELALRYTEDEQSAMISGPSTSGPSTSGPSASGPAITSGQSTSGISRGTGRPPRVFFSDSPSPSSSPAQPRRAPGGFGGSSGVSTAHRNGSLSGKRTVLDIITVDASEGDSGDEAANTGRNLPRLKVNMGSVALPEPTNSRLTLRDLREELCFSVTGVFPMDKPDSPDKEIFFDWIRGENDNVQNYIDFYLARADALAQTGRMTVRMDDAFDCNGPYKECIAQLLAGFRKYKIPNLGIALFDGYSKDEEDDEGFVLITAVPIFTEEGHNALRAFGFLLREGILHGCPFPDWFNSSALRYLLNLPIQLNDIFVFAPTIGDIIQDILRGSGEIYLEEMENFSMWADSNPAFPWSSLVKLGRETLCRYMAVYELCTKRSANLKFLYEGLTAGKMGKELLQMRPDWKPFEEGLYAGSVIEGRDMLEQFRPLNEANATEEQAQMVAWLDEICVEDLDCRERKQLLRFITGSNIIPTVPRISIDFFAERDENRRPTSRTCSNILKLPTGVRSKEKLLELLKDCIAAVDNKM
ncbi:uncharacterized protein LOC129586886 [Paramacrobiotus metropolitanus]|uniref:uncharacterized protein LOC129586886 n=1 Tax=Paramacrobiotus metropolitanus TaxID=2943436 RepID=UPI002445720C|nr:uncharacterized protein LOC129586886 [Paramacrobiotus metropolitanus]XP_055336354.1 uncharacterized protein LOC129586886 [Paramacrobiotus metropolitanus]XP_055336362.1 uncharacterized protein LOC129586886 [Paramacrobiotus metropolitanus]